MYSIIRLVKSIELKVRDIERRKTILINVIKVI